jgi:hypothetical protein
MESIDNKALTYCCSVGGKMAFIILSGIRPVRQRRIVRLEWDSHRLQFNAGVVYTPGQRFGRGSAKTRSQVSSGLAGAVER